MHTKQLTQIPDLVQVLLEPVNSRVLGTLKTLLLLSIVHVTTSSETVDQARVVIVVEVNAQLRQSLESELLELGSKHGVGLGDDELDGNSQVADLLLLEQRRVSDGDTVNQVLALAGKTENGPGAPAETNGSHLLVLRLELLSTGLDLGESLVLAVAAEEGHQVELLALLGVGQSLGIDDFAIVAVCVPC